MTQINAFTTLARMTNVARFFAGLAENAPYTVTTDAGRTHVLPTRTSARRLAETWAARTGGEAEVWADGRPLALIADHIGWCVPSAV
jgi:hypothetical protein